MRALALLLLLVGCASTHVELDASHTDDAATCTTLARPTGSCDPTRGVCCEASTHCERGYCRYPGWVCAGELGYCVAREDCCNARHSCVGNACMY